MQSESGCSIQVDRGSPLFPNRFGPREYTFEIQERPALDAETCREGRIRFLMQAGG